jgi:hypothetical protein
MGDQPLQPHPGVHVLGREELERAVLLAVELDEDVVPELDDIGVARVDQARGVPPADAVEVDLRAWPARARLAHLPEVVLHPPRQHVVRRQELEPQVPRLGVRLQPRHRVPLEVRRVHPVRGHPVDLRQQLEPPRDRLGLEVIAERPVPEHLEERVVVRVEPDVIKVVVLAAGADALLGVGGAGVECGRDAGPLRDVRLPLA